MTGSITGNPPVVVAADHNRWTVFSMILAVLFVLIAIALWFQNSNLRHEVASLKNSASQARTAEAAPVARAPEKSWSPTPSLTEQLRIAVVGKGGSYERSLIQQLEKNPSLADKTKFQFKGDRSDTKVVHRWAGRTAHRIAIGTGYADEIGGEMRIVDPNVAFLLTNADGKLHVAEYTAATGSNPQLKITRNVMAGRVSLEHFLGSQLVVHNNPPYVVPNI